MELTPQATAAYSAASDRENLRAMAESFRRGWETINRSVALIAASRAAIAAADLLLDAKTTPRSPG